MSGAVRRFDGRSQSRKAQSSPYARPQSSGWSLRKLLEPLKRRVFGQSVQNEEEGRGIQIPRSPSPIDPILPDEPSYVNVLDTESHVPGPPRSPSKTVSPKRPPPTEGPSTRATLENVIEFLTDATGTSLKREEAHTIVGLIRKGISHEHTVCNSLLQSVGRPLGAIEIEGMISLIRKQMPYERSRSEPFRFESATPSRGNSPLSPTPSGPGSPKATPRKMLSRNPNGTYRWQGAGSAKQTPRRNRYSSPAFGTPKLAPEKAKTTDSPVADGKRRRLDEEQPSMLTSTPTTSSSASTQRLPFPISSPAQGSRTTASGTSAAPTPPKLSIPAAPSTPSRLRTPALLKPTTPSQPSPLRHAWTGSPDTSQEDISQSDLPQPESSSPKPTKAADLMSELIKEATPPKKPDLSNPYQTASPLAKVGPPRRSTRRTRASARATIPENNETPKVDEGKEKGKQKETVEKTKEYPPEAIFEATLPKGSKRSRPPAQLDKSTPSDSRRSPSPRQEKYVVEEVDEDDRDRSHKKQKGVNGFASKAQNGSQDVEIEEVEKPPASGQPSSAVGSAGSSTSPPSLGPRPVFGGLKPATAPSRPSKLRQSFLPEGSAPSTPETQSKSMDIDAPSPSTRESPASSLPTPEPSFSEASTSKRTPPVEKPSAPAAAPAPVDPKQQVLVMSVSVLPTFSFTAPKAKAVPPEHVAAREEALSKPVSSLPTFDFSREALKAGPSKSAPAPAASTGFNWAAAGLKPPTASGSEWKCSDCMCNNPDSAKEKCTVCEAPRPGAKKESAAPAAGFNWTAAGLKPPTTSGSNWKCSDCMCDNPDSAKEKCTVCEAPRPGAKKESAAPVAGFNWGAAGLKPPTTSGSTWTCSVCALSNPTSAPKCTVCDAPR
ncbi:hypothetical protein CC2G_011752 [Coprinopsis cinerea AmutBmut pab1-1]|nr:hypothetical protein CC2G_011752 [Coprinopsis cinerea AmutBmut pab1-1]